VAPSNGQREQNNLKMKEIVYKVGNDIFSRRVDACHYIEKNSLLKSGYPSPQQFRAKSARELIADGFLFVTKVRLLPGGCFERTYSDGQIMTEIRL